MKIALEADMPVEKQPRPNVALLSSKLTDKLPAGTAVSDDTPVVTVVTAVFNAVKEGRKEEFLQCLDSVQAQLGTTIEHLVIDGASADGTADLVRDYQNRNYPIRLLSEPDSGIYDAMNRGLYLARGKYVIFLNSDDFYSDPNGLADSVKALEISGADFSYSPVTVLSETTGLPIKHRISEPDVNIIFVEMPFCHQSIMLRRSAMLSINGFDLRYRSGADYDSVLRLIFSGHRACAVTTNFVTFRLGGFSFVNVGQSQKEVGMIFSRIYSQHLGIALSPEAGKELYLTKQAPKELKQRLFSLARSVFGDAVVDQTLPENDPEFDDDLLELKNRLHDLKWCRNFPALAAASLRLFFHFPIRFCQFLFLYFRYRRSFGKNDAGKMACEELLCKVQDQRNRKAAAVSANSSSPKSSPQPAPVVSHRDYWRTNGIYPGESWGAWTGGKFSVFLKMPQEYVHQPLKALVSIGGYVFPQSPKRIISIVVNGRELPPLTVDNFMPQRYRFDIPAEVNSAETLDIDFISDRTFSPKSQGHGEDARELGMSFRKFTVSKTDA